ncbi:14833_t:CDS:1, partial [Gigaspora margarita]
KYFWSNISIEIFIYIIQILVWNITGIGSVYPEHNQNLSVKNFL